MQIKSIRDQNFKKWQNRLLIELINFQCSSYQEVKTIPEVPNKLYFRDNFHYWLNAMLDENNRSIKTPLVCFPENYIYVQIFNYIKVRTLL